MHADSQEQPTLRAAFRVHTAPCTQVRINTPKDPTFPGYFVTKSRTKRKIFLRNLLRMYMRICVFCKEINIQRCFFIENCVIVIFTPRNYSSQMLFFLTTWIYLSIVFLMEKKIFIKERKMFGIYANFSLGTQKIFCGALTHYMSYYYFKGYMYTCIEWHVGVSVLSPATQVSRYSRYVTNITHEYFMDLIAEIF